MYGYLPDGAFSAAEAGDDGLAALSGRDERPWPRCRTRCLSLFELGDLTRQGHMSVPKTFRRTADSKAVVLHRATLAPTEVTQLRGLTVCRPCGAVRSGSANGCRRRSPPHRGRGAAARSYHERELSAMKSGRMRENRRQSVHDRYKCPSLRRALEDRLLAWYGVRWRHQPFAPQTALIAVCAFSGSKLTVAAQSGYAMNFASRLRERRATLIFHPTVAAERDSGMIAIRSLLENAAAFDLEDSFEFIIGEPTMDLDAAPYAARATGRARWRDDDSQSSC